MKKSKPSPGELAPLIMAGQFKRLFVEKLGWDLSSAPPVTVRLGEGPADVFILQPVAEKRGVTVLALAARPEKAERGRIEKIVAQSHLENLIIYSHNNEQIWQWAKRLAGRRTVRETAMGAQARDLAQRLALISIELDEEAELTLGAVAGRLAEAFDVDKVVKKFYRDFKVQLGIFASFIRGLEGEAPRSWYASLTLNRLMFIYFFQKKNFLDNNPHYLRDKLEEIKERGLKGEFQTFYRLFLRRLFHEGLGQPEKGRAGELSALLGRVPYLNGGLFEVHELEAACRKLDIADEAFEKIFEFFDKWQWSLDDRPGRADNEINPDVLGHIFEQYINNKEMGAYYTKEDITGYIARNSLLPWFFQRLGEPVLKKYLWPLLKERPRDWLYPAVLTGLDEPLPPEIAAGLDNVARRGDWNKAAADGLPTETWRECVARRRRVEELLGRLERGEIITVGDLITHNLDIEKLARALIENCDDPAALKAIWEALTGVTVLDPTCGSGAFLFAALNILAPLYGLALEKMKAFTVANPKKFEKFRTALAELEGHPNRNYFVLKRIIMNNLYGVDIMKEAVEICKLRLFLKLAAQLERPEDVEPLPDVDFNIKAGNTLVGYVSRGEIEATLKNNQAAGTLALVSPDEVKEILEKAELADMAYGRFRESQLNSRHDPGLAESKAKLQKSLDELRKELDFFLARDYTIDPNKKKEFQSWRESCQPFHWLAEFYGIMNKGGFDVIIGNPPYKALSAKEVGQFIGYTTAETKNLYPLVMERSDLLVSTTGRQGFIVPVSSVSTDGYSSLQKIISQRNIHYSSYDDRPCKLFNDLEHIRLTIHIIGCKDIKPNFYATKYHKWNKDERVNLFKKLQYASVHSCLISNSMPKISYNIENEIISKIALKKHILGEYFISTSSQLNNPIYYSRKTGYFLVFSDFIPDVFYKNNEKRLPAEFKEITCRNKKDSKVISRLLKSI